MSAADRGWASGWPDCQRDKQVNLTVAGVSFPGGVHRDVKPILAAVAEEFHRDVEELVEGWCWGFACRAISGTSRPSNHSWGLAIDVNAPRHPMGKGGTFTPAQAKRCREIAAKYGCRWGGDYSRPDEMHFEYMGTRAEALAFTDPQEDEMALKPGDSGKAVERYQEALLAWRSELLPEFGADADYGDETEEGVRKFQYVHDLPITGVIDGVTAEMLGSILWGAAIKRSAGLSQSDADARYAKKSHGTHGGGVTEKQVRDLIGGHASNPDAHHA